MRIKKYVFGSFVQNGIIINDPDAQAFIDAAPIVDSVQINAINTLVLSLKEKNIWNKMQAIYPFVGGTASTHKLNLKDPRDLNTAFRITYSGTQLHDHRGVTHVSGSSLVTNFIMKNNSVVNDFHWSSYVLYDILDYLLFAGNSQFFNKVNVGVPSLLSDLYDRNGGNARVYTPNSNGSGFYTASRTLELNRHAIFKDGIIKKFNSTTSGILGLENISIGNLSSSGNTIAFSTIGKGLTDVNVFDLYAAVQACQTTLGRQI